MKQKIKHLQNVIAVALCVIMSLSITSCSDDDDEDEQSIVGTWRLTMLEPNEDGIYWYCQYNLKSDGTFEVKDWSSTSQEPTSYEAKGKWSCTDDTISLSFDDEGYTETYKYKLEGNNLIIYDYEEDGPNVFVRI